MFIENLINGSGSGALTELVKFTAARQTLLANNMANVDIVNYKQQDLSVEEFQKALQQRIQEQADTPGHSVSFDDISMDVEHPKAGILFHDGNNRSMEQLVTDQMKNGLIHNMAIELLRKQFSTMEMALKEHIS